MPSCPNCGTTKLLNIDFCVDCGHGDVEKDLDRLTEEDLEYAIRTRHGLNLVNSWNEKFNKSEVRTTESEVLQIDLIKREEVSFRGINLVGLFCIVAGSIYATAKYAFHYL